MGLAFGAVIFGLVVLVWSADRFVDGAAATARHFGMPSLLIGMLIVGFGTSAPEIAVSVIASIQGNPAIALGNAFGSNIANIGMVLGITAIIVPILVESQVLKKEIPILVGVTILVGSVLLDGELSTGDSLILLVAFVGLMGWSIQIGLKQRKDALAEEIDKELDEHPMQLNRAVMWLILGLILLVVSSRVLVWGAVEIAQSFGMSDMIIGLTIVAIGTSLPELASSIAAARKGEQDIALGNVIGSNLFNTLAVVGIAGLIRPFDVGADVLWRDVLTMTVLTVGLMIVAWGFRNKSLITRQKGTMFLLLYVGYTAFLIQSVITRSP
jgi:cation:H+ antiporter